MSNKDSEDHAIILQCQCGDKNAFGKLVNKYMKRAYYSALGLIGSHDAALDLSQDAFVRAYKAIGNFDPEKQFFTWLYKILRNLCFNYLRDKKRHASSFSEIGEKQLVNIKDSSQNIDNELIQNDMKELLWQAIDKLKPAEREIIILKDFQDMSYKEIAGFLECPIGTVMSRLYNARKVLKLKLERCINE